MIFLGNIDSTTKVKNMFPYTFVARIIRLCPKDWVDNAALKWELFGCGTIGSRIK